jgi:hypothetical protein
MKSPSISIESLSLLLKEVLEIQQDMSHTAGRVEAAMETVRRAEDPTPILREVASHLRLSESTVEHAVSRASALLVVI